MNGNLGKISIIIMGEAENCIYEEKIAVASVAWNRLLSKEYKFNPLEKDFYGYSRNFSISNILERKALEDSIKASYEAYNEIQNGKYSGLYFFSLKNHKKPGAKYELEEIYFPEVFKHNFYRIKNIY